MVKGIDNELLYFIVSHHINHFLNVKKMVKHDYESHMILSVVYRHFLYQTITLGKTLSWTEVFDETETEDHKRLMKDKKLTTFAVAENLSMPQETVRRKLEKLIKKKLLDYSISDGLSLGKKFKETIEPLGKADGKDIFALVEKFKKA
jgi:predicted HTH transcriptional regulator